MGLFVSGLVVTLLAGPAYPQTGGNLTLRGQLLLPGDPRLFKTDVWGWVDPNTNKEYAIIGEWPSSTGLANNHLFIIDVSDPTNPTLVTTINQAPGFDMKTWGNLLYAVDGNPSGIDGKIYDISDPLNPVDVGNFGSAHNIFIDDAGYLYLCAFYGLKIYNLNPDPLNPTFVWADSTFDGHNVFVKGDRLYDFHGSFGTLIYDITNRASPVLLRNIGGTVYSHAGWTSEDGEYLFITDEYSLHPAPDIQIWKVVDPATAFQVGFFGDPTATAHDVQVRGNFAYFSYYTAGVRVFDVSDPSSAFLTDHYDTSANVGEGFAHLAPGAWGVYALAPSGNIYVSDMDNGLFVFSFEPNPTGITPAPPSRFILEQNFPNPFNPVTTISFELTEGTHTYLSIYDTKGQEIRTLVNGWRVAGPHAVDWYGRNNSGLGVSSGVYFYRLSAFGETKTRKMVLLQ